MALFEFGIRQLVVMILFFTYIYDAIRREFIESRSERLNQYQAQINRHNQQVQQQQQQQLLNRRTSIAGRSGNGCFGGIRIQNDPQKCFFNDMLAQVQRDFEQQQQQQQQVIKPEANIISQQKQLVESSDACPLREIPRFMRVYQIFSTIYIVYSFIRYIGIVVLQYEIFDFLDPSYSCYLPGRLSFTYDMACEVPLLSLVIISYHIIYRYIWYCAATRLNLDCFVFACYEEREVIEKEASMIKLENEPLRALELYLKENIFFQRTQNRDLLGLPQYKLKIYRTRKHWIKLNQTIKHISYFFLSNFALLGLPVSGIIVANLLSNEYFDKNYLFCRSFANRPIDKEFKWSFSDPYRKVIFFLDLFDNIMLFVDTTCALTWPFTASIVCTQDLSLGLETLSERLAGLKRRLAIRTKQMIQTNNFPSLHRASIIGSKKQKKYCNLLEREIQSIQEDIVVIFEQVGHVDKFMKIFAAFCLFCWLLINLAYELTSIMKNQYMKPDLMAQFLQAFGLIVLTVAFAFFGRTYTQTIRMYHELCCVMTYDPNYQTTKQRWLKVLEYYHKNKSMFSLHIGSWYVLSMSNYLKSIAWSVSCSFMFLNLLHHKLGQ